MSSLREVQQSWGYLENLFIHSEEVKKELPKAAEEFVGIVDVGKARWYFSTNTRVPVTFVPSS